MAMLKPTALLLLVVTGLFAAWFLLLRPGFLGGPASYLIVSGTSMEPTLRHDDLALLRKQGSYEEGDIVAFRVEGGMVIHRIVDETADGFVTQGDNKNSIDPWSPTADDIVGRLWFSIPGGGRFVHLLRQPLPLGALAGAFGMLMVLFSPRWPLSLSVPGRRRRGPDHGSEED